MLRTSDTFRDNIVAKLVPGQTFWRSLGASGQAIRVPKYAGRGEGRGGRGVYGLRSGPEQGFTFFHGVLGGRRFV